MLNEQEPGQKGGRGRYLQKGKQIFYVMMTLHCNAYYCEKCWMGWAGGIKVIENKSKKFYQYSWHNCTCKQCNHSNVKTITGYFKPQLSSKCDSIASVRGIGDLDHREDERLRGSSGGDHLLPCEVQQPCGHRQGGDNFKTKVSSSINR